MTHQQLLLDYFPDISQAQLEQFEKAEKLYQEWNEKINVISRKDIEFLYERHFIHSLGIAKVISFKKGTEVLDVGTGGGFPGIPLAILFPRVHFHLIDSIGKKIKVVKAVADGIGLTNVKIEQIRAELVPDENYDFVVSRAVTQMPEFCGWVKDKFKSYHQNALKNGILYLKGGDLAEELKPIRQKYRLYNLSNYFEGEWYETKKVVYIPMTK
jgi:16S rRNA (guanine527-N7)-methyltransferase